MTIQVISDDPNLLTNSFIKTIQTEKIISGITGIPAPYKKILIHKKKQAATMSIVRKVLVVGSTGATGKHVVRMLLERGDTEVVAVARSEEKLVGLVNPDNVNDENMKNLVVKETTIANMALEELKGLVNESSAVVR